MIKQSIISLWAISAVIRVSEAFSPIHASTNPVIAPLSTLSGRRHQKSALFGSPYVIVHEDGMSQEDKDELMPCEVKRYGRVNEKVQRGEAYNPDGPPLHNPMRKPPPRRPSKPASAYMGVHDEVEDTTRQAPAHLFQRHERKKPVVDARVIPSEPERISDQQFQQHQSANSFQPHEYGPKGQAPPMGMFLDERTGGNRARAVPASVSTAPPRTSPAAPPMGLFQDAELKAPSVAPIESPSSSSSGRRTPGPPPVGLFLKDHVDTSLLESFVEEPPTTIGPSEVASPPMATFSTPSAASSEVDSHVPATFSTFSAASSASQSFGGFQKSFASSSSFSLQPRKFAENYMRDVRSSLMVANGAVFIYQVLTTAFMLMSQRSVPFWPHSLTGTAPASAQPILRDWMFTRRLAAWQPHRYLTAGFVHSGVLHFLLNTDAFRIFPEKLEQTVGADVYGTTFALSLVAGHLGHSIWGGAVSATGAGAGIAGLYGLCLVHEFIRGQNGGADRQSTLRSVGFGLGRQILYGLCLPRMFSTAATISGFLSGIVAGAVFTSSSSSSGAVGGDRPRNMAVFAVWLASLSALVLLPDLRSAPLLVLQSLFQPGSLSTMGRGRFYNSL